MLRAKPSSRKVAGSLTILFGSELVGQIIAFATNVYLARALSKDAFGHWAFVVSIIVYALVIVDCGTETWGTREISTDHARLRRTLRAVIAVRGRTALVVAAFLVGAAVTVPLPSTERILLLGGLVTILVSVVHVHWLLRGLERMLAVAIGSLIQRATFFALVVFSVGSSKASDQLTLWQGAADGAAALIWLAALSMTTGKDPLRSGQLDWWATLRQSWPFAVGRVLRGGAFALNFALVALYWPDAALGDYGVSQRLANPLLIVSTVFGIAVFPAIVRAALGGTLLEIQAVDVTFRLLATMTVPVAIGGAVMSSFIIEIVFGKIYVSAAPILVILLLAFLLTVFSDNARRLLHARHRQHEDLRLIVIGTVGGVILNLVIVPFFGPLGAAVAVLATEGLIAGLVLRALNSGGFSSVIVKAIVRPGLAALAAALAAKACMAYGLVFAVVCGVLVYLAGLFALGVHPLRDIRNLEPSKVGGSSHHDEATASR